MLTDKQTNRQTERCESKISLADVISKNINLLHYAAACSHKRRKIWKFCDCKSVYIVDNNRSPIGLRYNFL